MVWNQEIPPQKEEKGISFIQKSLSETCNVGDSELKIEDFKKGAQRHVALFGGF